MKTGCCSTGKYHTTEKHTVCLNERCDNYLGQTLVYREVSKWKSPITKGVLIMCLMFTFDDFGMENEMQMGSVLTKPAESKPLNFTNLEEEIKKQNMICPELVMAQIKVESGNLTSFLLKKTNNMLGMRYPFVRKSTACGMYIPSKDTIIYGTRAELRKYSTTLNYAVYEKWEDGIEDYKLWQQHCFKVSDKYADFLGSVYAEDPQYVGKIKKVAALNKK